ncbi:MAG TPA: hypothetical protein VK656_00320 [Candidatus Acidoferrum sp.]|nr:hypothetical protein [Candidatus Acidoferrum sp.]
MLHQSSGCIWVEFQGQKARPLWPAGFTAGSLPFIVYDRSGREVGRDGTSITTQMLGPDPVATDGCGLSQTINLYFPDADGGGIGHTNGG